MKKLIPLLCLAVAAPLLAGCVAPYPYYGRYDGYYGGYGYGQDAYAGRGYYGGYGYGRGYYDQGDAYAYYNSRY